VYIIDVFATFASSYLDSSLIQWSNGMQFNPLSVTSSLEEATGEMNNGSSSITS